jgi:hypothetical protein
MGVVTTNYFQLVGARVIFGRDFSDEDGQPQPPPPAPGANTPPPPRLPMRTSRRSGRDPALPGSSSTPGP